MTLETLYFITQIIAVVLIFPTLVFLAIQNRQSQKQMERANEIARAEFSAQIMRNNMVLLSQLVEDVELGLAFRQMTIENNRIEDPDTRFRLLTWFGNYSILWIDMVAADEKGLIDDEVKRMISGAQAFHLTFPVVWDAMVRTFAQRALDAKSYETLTSRMVTLRDKAHAHKSDMAAKFEKLLAAQENSADTPASDKGPDA